METLKRIGRYILFPHIAIILLLVPFCTALLVYSLVFTEADTPVSYISYMLAFYTLSVVCIRIPDIIALLKRVRTESSLVRRFFEDAHMRVNLSLYSSLILNAAYAIFQLGLGFYHASVWFYAMSAFYLLLALMRFFLLGHSRVYKPGERMRAELTRYIACGWMLLVMNLALSVIIFFMIYRGRTFVHSEITTITMAAYTFTAFTVAIIDILKYRKYNSPVFSASKAIALVVACVSMLTLETTMLTTFGDISETQFRQIMLGATGAAVSLFTVGMALFMIIRGIKRLRQTNV